MKKMSQPILFFGSGPVAAESLRLLARDFVVEGVITKPRPPHHKGDVPVVAVAEELGLPIWSVTNKTTLDQLMAQHSFASQVAILIDFGIIVSQKVIDTFPLGIINSHFSLLPQWRGADPITFAILSGQKQTGVSLMLLVEAMDEGPLLGFGTYNIEIDTTTPMLTAHLIQLSHELITQIVPDYVQDKIMPQPQDHKVPATYSRKLAKEDGLIDWHKPAAAIEREVRAYLGWPGSRTSLAGKDVIITKTHVVDAQAGEPGKISVDGKQLRVVCGEGALSIDMLKPAGKKEMAIDAFLAGHLGRLNQGG